MPFLFILICACAWLLAGICVTALFARYVAGPIGGYGEQVAAGICVIFWPLLAAALLILCIFYFPALLGKAAKMLTN